MNHTEHPQRSRWLRCAAVGGGLCLALALSCLPATAAPALAAPATSRVSADDQCDASETTDSEAQLLADRIDHEPRVDLARERAFDRWVASRATTAQQNGVDITVYFHNFHRTAAQEITEQQVLAQLAVLNRSYAGGQGGNATRFEFVLGAYENLEVSSATVRVRSARARTLKAREHVGGRTTLNIYSANRLRYSGEPIQGIATPPWQVGNLAQDGIWIQRGTMPGVPGGPAHRADGDVLVHEVGHWLGLYHVFRGFCRGSGDRVADTGRMSRASSGNFGCSARNTCGNDGGRQDPVHNFMSASGDACMTSFTPGQVTRMSNMWDRYRA